MNTTDQLPLGEATRIASDLTQLRAQCCQTASTTPDDLDALADAAQLDDALRKAARILMGASVAILVKREQRSQPMP